MGALATGNRSGQAEALTLVMPMKWWGPFFHRCVFWFFSRRFARDWAFTQLEQLRFISAIRWSLLPPFEKRRWWRWPTHENRWHLLFESNFDGDWDDYLDSFGAAAKKALRFIVTVVVGYPGLDSMPMFKSFAKQYDHLPEYYMSAYPSLTASDIRQELHARYGRFAHEAIVKEGYGRTKPEWTTFLLPIKAGHAGRAVRAARRLDPGQPVGPNTLIDQPVTDGTFFRRTELVHFARVVVVDQPRRSWLLITMTHDGPVEAVLSLLLSGEAATSLRKLLECTDGVPADSGEWWSDVHLFRHLLAHRPPGSEHRLTYAAAPGWTAHEISSYESDARREAHWPVPEECS